MSQQYKSNNLNLVIKAAFLKNAKKKLTITLMITKIITLTQC